MCTTLQRRLSTSQARIHLQQLCDANSRWRRNMTVFGIFETIRLLWQRQRDSAWTPSPTQRCPLCCAKQTVRKPALRLFAVFGRLALVAWRLKSCVGALLVQSLPWRHSQHARRQRDRFGQSLEPASAKILQPVLRTIPSELDPSAAVNGWVQRQGPRYDPAKQQHCSFGSNLEF